MASPQKHPSGAQKRRRRQEKAGSGPDTLTQGAPVSAQVAGSFAALLRPGKDASSTWSEAIDFQREAMRRSVGGEWAEGVSLERTARIAAALVKSADLKKQLDERDAVIRQMAEDIAALEVRVSESARPRSTDVLQEHPANRRRPREEME